MIEAKIIQALQKGAIDAITVAAPEIAIAALGRSFTPPDDGRYFSFVHLPNNVTNQFWGDEKLYRGIFRVVLHWGIDDGGIYPPMRIIDKVASQLIKGTIFNYAGISVRIYEQPDLTGVIPNAPEMMFPVSIRYNCSQT